MKEVLGFISVVMTLAAYLPYFYNVLKGTTKPHAFSWLVWFTLTAVSLFIQITYNAGPGSWMLGVTSIICFSLFIAGLIRGEKNITLSDWFSLIGAFFATLLWFIFQATFISILLIVLADFFGFYPTIRKSLIHPNQETMITYFLSSVKAFLSLLAIKSFSFETIFYLFYLLLVNLGFVLILAYKRKYFAYFFAKIYHQSRGAGVDNRNSL